MYHPPHAPHLFTPRVATVRIDVFAVRQWGGNGADLDFRGVLKGCTAAIVAAAPIEGTLLQEIIDNKIIKPGSSGSLLERLNRKAFFEADEHAALVQEAAVGNSQLARDAFLKSDEYKAVAGVLPFCRLWCDRGHHTPVHICDPACSSTVALLPLTPISPLTHVPTPGVWWR